MNTIDAAIQAVKAAEDKVGAKGLSEASGVPLTTIYTLSGKGWRHKSLDNLRKLLDAAERLNAAPANDEQSAERAA
ncbi:MAG: hypothetical protein ACK4FB_07970 [Brevundimonas sp.]|uniref:hypothetical protein n=1 Tax=Brevundimonas sp. TaxID=1871086 RepID=UPI003919DFBB